MEQAQLGKKKAVPGFKQYLQHRMKEWPKDHSQIVLAD